MRFTRILMVLCFAAALGSATPAVGSAQLGGLKKKLDDAKKKAEEAAKKARADSANAKPAADSTKAATPDSAKSRSGAGAPRTEAKVWENYDFVPGNRVLIYTDFSDDKVGNFSRRLRYR